MKAFLGFVLGLITVGVFLIAYGVLTPRVNAAAPGWTVGADGRYDMARPTFASERVDLGDADRAAWNAPVPVAYEGATPRRVAYQSVPVSRTVAPRVERSSGRSWQKTAMVVGGTTAAGAGLGAIFGGKKGALIGAAIGGGASALYESRQR